MPWSGAFCVFGLGRWRILRLRAFLRVIWIAIEMLERDGIDLYGIGSVAARGLDALEEDFAPVRSKPRIDVVARIKRHLVRFLFFAGRCDEVDVGRPRRVGLRVRDPLAVR